MIRFHRLAFVCRACVVCVCGVRMCVVCALCVMVVFHCAPLICLGSHDGWIPRSPPGALDFLACRARRPLAGRNRTGQAPWIEKRRRVSPARVELHTKRDTSVPSSRLNPSLVPVVRELAKGATDQAAFRIHALAHIHKLTRTQARTYTCKLAHTLKLTHNEKTRDNTRGAQSSTGTKTVDELV